MTNTRSNPASAPTPAVGLLSLLVLMLACSSTNSGRVDANWTSAYRTVMSQQVAHPQKESQEQAPLEGFDALTSEIVIENYQLDTTRTPDQSDKTFVIDSGIP